jgi:uncharacterized protein YbjQ (UPF0145 family)
MPVPIYTVKLMNRQDKDIIPLGTVVGNDSERISLIRSVGDDFMGIFGWSSGIMRKKMNDLVENAKDDLQKNVAEQFPEATAVYDVDFNFNTNGTISGSKSSLDLVITGTAVIEKQKINNNIKINAKNNAKTLRKNNRSARTRRSRRS